jgi:transmembrane sensor
MNGIIKLRTRAEIDEQAAAWIWRMESGATGDTDPEAFEDWLRKDPRHRRAIDEMSRAWDALDGLAETKRNEKIATFTDAAKRTAFRDNRRWWFAAAAMLLMTAGSIAWLRGGSEVQTLATAVGQRRDVALADGSIVTLNTNTIVETDISRHVREIYLRKGEAHFQVAHDRSRPFLVHAGDSVVRAVGTEFEVRVRTDQHVDVVVTEGRVEVKADASNPRTPLTETRGALAAVPVVRAVSAGEQLSTATANYTVIPVSQAQLSSELAWREGAIIFDSQPLSEAITEIERYTDARIIVSDPQVATLRVGGRFKTDDLQGLLDGLEAALPVTIRRTSDGVIYIEARD